MCGICGIVSDQLSSAEQSAAVERMSAAMTHRGPDDSGIASFEGACLGMRRLAIQDLSPLGHQPMSNEDGSAWLVFNGEIYNFQELRAGLERRGHRFRSRTDTETIIHLYEDEGERALEGLRGMFAIAIWDASRREMLLARDRLGIKPLYHAQVGGGAIFASELSVLAASGLIEARLDLVALNHYLSFGYVPPPRTMLRGVSALLPGHSIRFKEGGATDTQWWRVPAPGSSAVEAGGSVRRVRELLEESIQLHRISDVPVGAFLSGGIDSTAVVGLMSRLLDEPVRTFSIGFHDGPATLNELDYARATASAFQTRHTEVVIGAEDVRQHLSDAVSHIDQPSFDGLNTYFVSRAAREGGVTVALSGLGGDEVFGGYGTFDVIPRWAVVARSWGAVPQALRRTAAGAAARFAAGPRASDRRRKLKRLEWVDSPIGMYAMARLTMWPSEVRELYSEAAASALDREHACSALDVLGAAVSADAPPWRMVTELEMKTYMGWRLLRDTDTMSMAHSLEVRVPLIDHKIVEFVCGLPTGWERELGYPKRLLLESLADILPPAILNRPKQGFAFPLEHWMRGPLRPLVEDALLSAAARGLFDADGVEALWQEFLQGRQPYAVVWQLVILELWLQQKFPAGVVV